MNYHVMTPLSRKANLPRLSKMFDGFDQAVAWTLICEDKDTPEVEPERAEVMLCPAMPEGYGFIGSWKSNYFLDHTTFEPETRYCLLNDDDLYPSDFFDLLDDHHEDFIIVSMQRGDHQPPGSPHPGGVLIACPENLRPGYIGGEQIILAGALQKDYRLGHSYEGDWYMLADILAHHKPRYAPEAHVMFNALEEGRWDGLPK